MPKNDKSKDRKLIGAYHTQNAMLNGANHSVLLSNLMEDVYGIGYNYSKSGAEKVIAYARKILKEDFQYELPHLKEKIMAQYYDVYTDAKESGQYQSAIKALENITKLVGLNEPDRKEITLNNVVIDFAFEEPNPIGFKTEEEDITE